MGIPQTNLIEPQDMSSAHAVLLPQGVLKQEEVKQEPVKKVPDNLFAKLSKAIKAV